MKEKKTLEAFINISKTKEDILKNLKTYDLTPDESGYEDSILHQLANMHGVSDSNRIEILDCLVAKGYLFDVNARNKRRQTALFLAIKNHRFRYAEMLVLRGADISANEKTDNDIFNENNIFYNLAVSKYVYDNDFETLNGIDSLSKTIFSKCAIKQEDSKGNNFLQQAIIKSHRLLVQYFVEYSTDVNYRNNDGVTALELAGEHGLVDMMLLLLNKGAKVEKSIKFCSGVIFNSSEEIFSFALFDAIENNEEEIVQQTLKHLSSDENKESLEFKNKVLAQWNEEGLTPLHVAVKMWKENVVKILIEHGADINKLSSDGVKPLFMMFQSVFSLTKQCVSIFLKEEVFNPNDVDPEGETLLHLFCRSEYFFDTIEMLVKAKADINKTNKNGDTPLHNAVLHHQVDYVEILLKAKADCIKSNNQGIKPLDSAISKYNLVKEQLDKSENSGDQKEIRGWKELMSDYRIIIEKLLDAGAGLYVSCELQIPEGINTEGKLLLGSNHISREIKGCEKAITSIKELQNDIKQGVKLDQTRLIDICNRRLADKEEINNRENLRLLRSTLYQLVPDSLVNICLNTLNQNKARFFREAAISEESQIPIHFKQALNPDVSEIVIDESSSSIPSPIL